MTDRYAELRAALADGSFDFDQRAYMNDVRALLAERDALLETLWVITEHNYLFFGERHSTVIHGRAALAQEQGEKHDNQE